MKIVFLDFDGVLNNRESLRKGIHLLPEKVLLVGEICKRTKAKIVISSTWRMGTPIKVMKEMMWRAGLRFDCIIDYTSKGYDGKRGEQIEQWLRENNCDCHVVLDDEKFDMGDQVAHLVQTTIETGLTQEHVEQAVAMLGEENNEP